MCFLQTFPAKPALLRLQFVAFIAMGLFGQVLFSVIAHFLDFDNRVCMLLYRGSYLCLCAYIVVYFFKENNKIFLRPFPISLFLFWLYYFTRLVWDFFVANVDLMLPVWEFFAWGIGSCFLPSLTAFVLAGRVLRQSNSATLGMSGVLMLGTASILFFLINGVEQVRFMLPSLNPINASQSFLLLSLIGLSSVLWGSHSNRRIRALSFAVFFLALMMGAYAGSRGAMLSFVASFIVLIFLYFQSSSTFNRRKFFAVAGAFFASFSLFIAFVLPSFLARINTSGFDTNSILRMMAFKESFEAFLAHPLFGAGFRLHLNLQENIYSDFSVWFPHNLIAESLGLGGMLLSVALCCCLILAFRNAYALSQSFEFESWRLAILVASFGFVLFSGHLSNIPLFWIAMGIAASPRDISAEKS